MRVALVTGSRVWSDGRKVTDALDGFMPALVIHGECPTGADRLASDWVRGRCGILEVPMPARWSALGKKAGPERNAAMVSVAASLAMHGHEVCVFVFSVDGSRGTRDCARRARDAGLHIRSWHEGTEVT